MRLYLQIGAISRGLSSVLLELLEDSFCRALLGSTSGRMVAGVLLLVAEVINRFEFSVDLEILTPRWQIGRELLKDLG